MKIKQRYENYFMISSLVVFVVIFDLVYVFHEIIMGSFFEETIGPIQRNPYIIPLIALAFILYELFQAHLVDSGYHTLEGILTAPILSFFIRNI